tara:strand:+ start:372 stop:521 length:150 start_codon:yes stop_codon:yes gene_type:complete
MKAGYGIRTRLNERWRTGLQGFTTEDLGYQPSTLTMINKITDEPAVEMT